MELNVGEFPGKAISQNSNLCLTRDSNREEHKTQSIIIIMYLLLADTTLFKSTLMEQMILKLWERI